MGRITSQHPLLIVVGGYPGSGKTSVARQLAADLHLPRLSSDAIGDTIRTSQAIAGNSVNAMWLAYDIVFDLCAAFIQSGVSTILDLNMGWAFQWQRLNDLRTHHPTLRCSIIILRCPRDVCHARIRERHRGTPTTDPVEQFEVEPRFFALWQFLEQLDHPDIESVDAARAFDTVYHEVRQRIMPIVSA
jgi:predicted kinase